MIRIRGGSGLGDSIYLRPLVEYFRRRGEEVRVASNFADVFIGTGANVVPFTRHDANVVAHYTLGKNNPATNQWQDICAAARVSTTLPLATTWEVTNPGRTDAIRAVAGERPIVLVHAGREPMARGDGFGASLMPQRKPVQAVLDSLRDCFTIGVGKHAASYPLSVDLDLNGETSVAELFDLMTIATGAVGQVSFLVPLAEMFDKPLLAVWSIAGLSDAHPYVRSITPQKVLSKGTSSFVFDNAPAGDIANAAHRFRDSIRPVELLKEAVCAS